VGRFFLQFGFRHPERDIILFPLFNVNSKYQEIEVFLEGYKIVNKTPLFICSEVAVKPRY
jgi:hypothetical protein